MFIKSLILCVLFVVLKVGNLANGIPVKTETFIDLHTYFDNRIIGGTEAEDRAPHMVAVVVGNLVPSLICGGSLISEYTVLTAAHCNDAVLVGNSLHTTLRGLVGSDSLSSGWNQRRISFSGHVNHPEWDFLAIKNDIGMLFMVEKLVMSGNVAAVPLSFERVGGGERAFVTGWGSTQVWGPTPDRLQYLQLHTMEAQQCMDVVAEAGADWFQPPVVDPDQELCTFHSHGHGLCHGDSGGALVLKKDGKQIGIVSWGFPCALGLPDMFVRVSNYESFLKQGLTYSIL